MKKIIISILIFLFAFSVLAKTDEIPASGLTPDSPFYFLKAWKESIQTFFTFGAENKAKQYLHLAEVRLAEYQKMVEKGKTEIAEKTLKKYENQLNNALQKTEELKNKGKDVTELSNRIEQTVSGHLQVLQENLQKAPEQAKKGLENAIENSQKQIEKIRGETKACSAEAKICPDGTAVGRTGPNCEFAACPETKADETADWKTYRNEEYGFEVGYPSDWTSNNYWCEDGGFFYVAFGSMDKIDSEPLATLRVYPNQTTLDKFIKYFDYVSGNWKDTTLGGVTAKEVVSIGQDSKQFILITSVKNSYGYELASTVFGDNIDTVRKMNSTLRFLK